MLVTKILKLAPIFLIWMGLVDPAQSQMVVAHRGASFDAPENTISAFNLAWEQDADAIEGDFHLTRDNQIVCIHDRTTKRVSPALPSLVVSDTNLADLRKYDVGSWKNKRFANERPPTLAEVLATVPVGKKIFIEVKTGVEIIPHLKRELGKSDLKDNQIVIICFKKSVVKLVRQQMPEYKASWLTSYSADNDQKEWRPIHPQILRDLKDSLATGLGTQFNTEVVNDALVQSLRKAEREVHVWTVDDADEVREAIKLNVDSITTNRPARVRRLLTKSKSESRPTEQGKG